MKTWILQISLFSLDVTYCIHHYFIVRLEDDILYSIRIRGHEPRNEISFDT